MEFQQKRSSRARRGNKFDAFVDANYPHRLSLYSLPPTENISLQEFEEFAVERLKVLKVVETIGIRHLKGSKDYNDAMRAELTKLNMKIFLETPTNVENRGSEMRDRRKDHISHFILRLAYSKSEDLRRWFLMQEMDLFRYRFLSESEPDSVKAFLDSQKLNYQPIPDKEKNELRQELVDSSMESAVKFETTDYFKVPFTEVLDLVKGRKVYLRKGEAYVPRGELASVVQSVFRSQLSHALAVTNRALPHLEEDGRLIPMLNGLSTAYLGQSYTGKKQAGSGITADMVDELSKKSFPLCMQNLHQNLRANHHLKHGGRMQYGLFLKAIGMNLEEAMKFWRAEFCKTVDSEKFDKQYAYNIRHNYGKEGKRADYTPYSCMKIITSNAPGPGDSHGCPFRHHDVSLLKQKLQNMKIGKDGSDQIVDLVKGHHYQVACARYFELVHNTDEQHLGINHPNQYFEESQRILNGEKENKSLSQAGRTPRTNNSTPRTPATANAKRTSSTQKSTPTSSVKPPPPRKDLVAEFAEDDDTDLNSMDVDAIMAGYS